MRRRLRLGVGALAVALTLMTSASALAQDRAPMEFTPEEVTRADGGAPSPAPAPSTPPAAEPPAAAPPEAAPQEEDREAAPITKGAAGKAQPKPAQPKPAAPAPAASAPAASAPAPKVEAAKPAPSPPAKKKEKEKPAPKAAVVAPKPDEPPPPAIPPRVTLHVWAPEKANRFDPEEIVEGAMDEVLSADPRLRFTPFGNIVSPADEAFKALADADQALADGKKAYADMDLEQAKQKLQAALKAYQKYLPSLAARPDGIAPMRDGFLELSKVRFFEGNADGARDALRYAFVLDGTLRWNRTASFPAQMKKVVVEARLLYDTLGSGKLIIDSDPPGATVWLNGQKLTDRTPTQPIDAPNGPNFISYARRGYAPMTQAFEVAGGGEEARPLATLSRPAQNPLAPIDRARARIEDSPAPRTLKDACAMLNVDMLVLVKSSRPGEREDETPQVLTAYLYDARNFRIINRLEMQVEGDLPATARVMARELFHGARLDGVYFAPVGAVQPKWHEKLWSSVKTDWGTFRHWKGFWYVVGGVAGAVVVGTVVGVTASHQRQIAVDTVLLGGN